MPRFKLVVNSEGRSKQNRCFIFLYSRYSGWSLFAELRNALIREFQISRGIKGVAGHLKNGMVVQPECSQLPIP